MSKVSRWMILALVSLVLLFAMRPAVSVSATGNFAPAGGLTPTTTPTVGCAATATATSTATLTTTETPTDTPTSTPITSTPTATPTPPPTCTATPIATHTMTTIPTATPTPTNPLPPTNTPVSPTSTPAGPTYTPLPSNTPAPTDTPAPPTDTPLPATGTPVPPSATPYATNTPPTASPTVCPLPFVDLSGNVFRPAIQYLYCRNVVSGTDPTHYSPAGTATRGQFAKLVVLGFGLPFTTPANPSFTDVLPSYYAYLYIESGLAAGILNGYDAAGCQQHNAAYPCFLPNKYITRAELTKLVVLAAAYPLTTPNGGHQDFSDVPPSNIFYVFIETGRQRGIVEGYPDGTYRPNNPIRRDEMAQIVFKAMTTP